MKEQAVLFGRASSLVGVVTLPPANGETGELPVIILLNRARTHRVGPYRLFVRVARDLAAEGFVVFRFHFSGMGDSGIRSDCLPIDKSTVSETQEAMDYFGAARGNQRFILLSSCSETARVSFRTAASDPRVVGMVMVNPSDALFGGLDALTRYGRSRVNPGLDWSLIKSYSLMDWMHAIREKGALGKAIRVGGAMFAGRWYTMERWLFRNRREVFWGGKSETDFLLLMKRGVRVLLVNSESDSLMAEYLKNCTSREVDAASFCENLEIVLIKRHDYTFQSLRSQDGLLKIIHDWVLNQTFMIRSL